MATRSERTVALATKAVQRAVGIDGDESHIRILLGRPSFARTFNDDALELPRTVVYATLSSVSLFFTPHGGKQFTVKLRAAGRSLSEVTLRTWEEIFGPLKSSDASRS